MKEKHSKAAFLSQLPLISARHVNQSVGSMEKTKPHLYSLFGDKDLKHCLLP